jgi:hypothetical protein
MKLAQFVACQSLFSYAHCLRIIQAIKSQFAHTKQGNYAAVLTFLVMI